MQLDYADYETLYQGKTINGPIPFGGIPWDIAAPQPSITGLDFRGDVLDVGCGLGDNAAFVAAQGLPVTAVDSSPTGIDLARKRFPDSGIRFSVTDAITLPGPTEAFDTVLSCALLHCLAPADRIPHLHAVHRATRPGGVMHLIVFSDRVIDGLASPMSMSEKDVRNPLSATGWTIEELGESTLVADGATMAPLFDQQGLPHRDRPEMACWVVRATRT
ncbi:bifunctional 2-polyprenyl-6-hydroxyphenol methylase/3-demethylubiquinol 3-O-methyltransferase UbiG [Kutzneria buriramensis]|uniref:Methyltransferase family protein n=1 Tax=Kutzneria buriramensis TaxID=1045776 RepID=A0A3E0H3S5_9PSEU|nr:class I SAM-dependent methyltransferase [Kutzneria buriramensis]REH37198.1 methyltransferase family protein [Kutzneria buriramensis]